MDAITQFSELYAQGRDQEALPFAEEDQRLGEKDFGPNDPSTATLISFLALLHYTEGRYTEAEPLYERSLAIWEKALRPEQPDVATSLENYAALLREIGCGEEAEERKTSGSG